MTTAEYSPHSRAERVIATGRACLILFAIAGVLLAPADVDSPIAGPLRLLTVYGVYAVLLWLAIARGALITRRATSIQHGIDLTIAVILTMLTRGSGSPFFLFFMFVLLAATVRWQARGAWSTGLVVIATYLAVVVSELVTRADSIDVNRFAVRLGLLLVMTMVLGQLGKYQQELYSELHQLAAWPRTPARSLDELLHESLEYAARLLNVPVVVLLWQEAESPQTRVARWHAGRLDVTERTVAIGDLILVPHHVRRFLHMRSGTGLRTVAVERREQELDTPVLSGDLVREFSVDTAIGAALPERSHEGWLLLVNRPPRAMTTDHALLAEIAAADIGASLEHWYLSQRARDAAVAEERLRVSRDLHDGVLQSLTASRLTIAAMATQAPSAPEQVAGQLRTLERSLAHEQQELREVIQELRGRAPRRPTPLRDLCDRVERQWRIAVALAPEADSLVPPELNAATLLMVHEALANAVRHGQARAARVAIERRGQTLVVQIEDDGRGFPFRGRLQGEELAARNAGPRSLRERAETLGGSVAVTSVETGSTVEITIPITREPICA